MKKNKDIELYKKIKDVLIKKAEGYFYNEEILEYQTEDGKIKKVTATSNQTDTPTENEEKCEEGTDTKKEDKLTLSKKKITTHYIPPDLLAVKMLFEIYGEKIESTNELEKLEYQELLNIKKQLLEKLKEED